MDSAASWDAPVLFWIASRIGEHREIVTTMRNQVSRGDKASFLADVELRPPALEDGRGLVPVGGALGQVRGALEVAVGRCANRPAQDAMREVAAVRYFDILAEITDRSTQKGALL